MPSQLRSKSSAGTFLAIDLGTWASRIAAVRGEGSVCLLDQAGETEIPTVLALSAQGGMLAGTEARHQQTLFPQNTLLSLRSLVTADPADLRARGAFFPHALARANGSLLELEIGGRARTVLELLALYLVALRRNAESCLTRPVDAAVLTVPISFSPFDRQVLRLAARMAGFQRVRLIDEPTAVALTYVAAGVRGRVAVCTWGAGHFGASIVEAQADLLRVVASVGSSRAGGERLELALAADFLERLRSALGPFANEAHVARHVLAAAQRGVREIGAQGRAELRIRLAGQDTAFGHTYTLDDLQPWLEPLLSTVSELCRSLLADAKLSRQDLDGLLLAGGMSRFPGVQPVLEALLGRVVGESVDPLEAAVRGALVRARFLDREVTDPLVFDALSVSLGLDIHGGQVSTLLARGEMVPASAGELFTTYLERQTEVSIRLLGHQGLQWEPLAQVEISKIPPMKDGQPQLEVLFCVDEDGAIEVEGRESSKGKVLGVEVRPLRGLSSTKLSALQQEYPKPVEGDFADRLREELREQGHLLVESVREVIQRHPGVVTRDEKQLVTGKVQDLEGVLEGGDLVEMRSCTRELAEAAQPLMRRVLDKNLEALLR